MRAHALPLVYVSRCVPMSRVEKLTDFHEKLYEDYVITSHRHGVLLIS
jgi:hypothetical protein